MEMVFEEYWFHSAYLSPAYKILYKAFLPNHKDALYKINPSRIIIARPLPSNI